MKERSQKGGEHACFLGDFQYIRPTLEHRKSSSSVALEQRAPILASWHHA